MGDYFGMSLARPGDVDGDGMADLVVGAPGAASVGRAYIYEWAFDALPNVPVGVRASVRFGAGRGRCATRSGTRTRALDRHRLP